MIIVLSLLLLMVSYGDLVNPRDPCDAVKNASVAEVFPTEEIDILLYYDEQNFDWITKTLKYVNCSHRGLTSVPISIPDDVQLLDLSLNAIVSFEQNAFSRLTKLVALSLSWNCPKNPAYNIFYCKQNSVFFHEHAFAGVTQLKLLNLSNNIFKVFPKGLSPSIQYIDISSTAIFSMSFNDVLFLTNLVVVVAEYLCPANVPDICPSQHIKLERDTFLASNRSLKVLNFAFNNFIRHSISTFSYPNMIALNLAQTRISVPSKFDFATLKHLKYLNLNFLYPYEDIHVSFSNNNFDFLTKLEFLDLSNNMINEFSENFFQFNQNVTYLELSGNCLYRMVQDPIFLKNLRHLKHLYLGFNYCISKRKFEGSEFNKPSENVVVQLGPTFSTLSSLELLSFGLPHGGTNAIVTEERGLNLYTVNATSLVQLNDLTFLHTLSFTYCKVRIFDMHALANLTNLAHFDISNNHIEDLTNNSSVNSVGLWNQEHCKDVSIKFQNFYKRPFKIKFQNFYKRPSMTSSVIDRHKTIQSTAQSSTPDCNLKYKLDLSSNSLTKLHHTMFFPEFSASNFTSWLDLSSNLITTVRDHSFRNWKNVCGINLKSNPLRYIHHKAFDDMKNLKYIIFNSTKLIDQTYKALQFLNNINNNFHLQMTNGHFFIHFKPSSNRTRVFARNVVSVDLSGSEIVSKQHLEKAFHSFPHVTLIKLKSCRIPFINFMLPNKFVTYLDLSDNRLPNLPTSTLKNMPMIQSLFLSKNVIVYLYWNFAELAPNLEELDLSHNHINFIKSKVFNPAPNNLTKLWLNNNYLSQVSIESFSKNFLQKLVYFDLRWNAIGCNCKLTESFGWWLSQNDFNLQDRPGFVPFCSRILDYNLGGCAKCQLPQVGTGVSLLKYSCNKSCQAFLPKILCSTYLACIFLLFLSGYIIPNPKCKAWLSEKVLEDVITLRYTRATTEKAKSENQKFLYHTFVYFDLNNQATGDWVDNCLVPNIKPHCRVLIYGMNNPCGIPPATHLLFSLKASRKTVVILSGNLGLSQEFKYIVSVLEYLEFVTGIDHLVLLIFQNDQQVGGLVDRLRFNKPWSVLNVPEELKKLPIFWNCFNTILHN